MNICRLFLKFPEQSRTLLSNEFEVARKINYRFFVSAENKTH